VAGIGPSSKKLSSKSRKLYSRQSIKKVLMSGRLGGLGTVRRD